MTEANKRHRCDTIDSRQRKRSRRWLNARPFPHWPHESSRKGSTTTMATPTDVPTICMVLTTPEPMLACVDLGER